MYPSSSYRRNGKEIVRKKSEERAKNGITRAYWRRAVATMSIAVA